MPLLVTSFISIVLIKASWCTNQTHFCHEFTILFAKNASWFLLLQVLSLNWIHSKLISGAAFRTIGLTKIEFLPLDWIYRSIRIVTVVFSMPIHAARVRIGPVILVPTMAHLQPSLYQ